MARKKAERAPGKRSRMVGARLRKAREREGLTAADICRRTGYTKSYISEIESGKKWCKLNVFLDYCDAMRLPTSAVLIDTNPHLIEGLLAVRAAVGEESLYQFADMDPEEIKAFFVRGSDAIDAGRWRRR